MKYATWMILSALVILSFGLWSIGVFSGPSAVFVSEAQADEGGAKPAGPGKLPELKVDRGAPLLLDALPETPSKPEGPRADNEACYCCHRNYEGEELVEVHARENIGCMECHGLSIDHRNDEDHVTPPDIMFAAEKIEPACVKCHETHDAPARKVLAMWKKRCPAKENPEELVCTDCHGQHRLAFRTVWWDKHTRQFIRDEKRMKVAPDLTKKKSDEPAKEKAGGSFEEMQ